MSPTTPDRPEPQPDQPARTQKDPPLEPKKPAVEEPPADEHEGATEDKTGDLTGPGSGYDQEPEKVKDKGGVVPS